ncbi:hypothetical protein [Nocardioides sp.]|uniref:hypothetical protein n=1 Tax=Nocardioides sp. TaxID=35761 RepID=UPI003527B264
MDGESPVGRLSSAGARPAVVALRPGVPVLRRDGGHVQLGVGPEAVLVPVGPDATRLVGALEAGPVRWTAPDDALVARLWGAGLLVDAESWDDDRARWPGLAETAYSRAPVAAHRRLAGRAAARVGVDAPVGWQRALHALVAEAGLVEGPAPDAVLLVTRGEPTRSRVDALAHAGLAHLVVRVGAGEVEVGPFVVPGRTACLRCEDAHRTDLDPRWPVLLAQLTSRPARQRAAAGDADCEPVLRGLAWAWAVRELSTYAEGDLPATWSARVTIGPDLSLPRQELLRHPHCGCAWDHQLEAAGPAA